MNFESFLNLMPLCPGSKTLPITNSRGGLRYVTAGLPEFIGPDLAPSSTIPQEANPRVMIVSAAGAVGKSTLAEQIAHRKQAPIWDLAQAAAVGTNSMTGEISTSFGFSLAGTVSSKLLGGELFILVDALDEARVKANEAGFEAFVQNIAEIAKSAKGTPFVLLGRTQTAETVWLLLAEAGVAASLQSIQPFTRSQAEQYIEARIHNFDAAAAKRIAGHRQPFMQARDAVLDHLERAVGGGRAIKDDAVREFLGYAPVLETVALLLAKEGNYQEFLVDLNSGGKQPRRAIDKPLAMLEHVVTRLLQREQTQKLRRNIQPALENVAASVGWNAWDTLYSPDEQRVRLLSRILGQEYDACPAMPNVVRAAYEEQLRAWLPEHPFLREGKTLANKVFESYLFAIAMREYKTPLSKAVEDIIKDPTYKNSKLLADFYILLGEQCGEEVVAERQIGLLYDSLLAGETDFVRIRLAIEAGDPDEDSGEEDAAEGEFELVYSGASSSDQEQVESRSFQIVEPEGVIKFRRQLKEAMILTRSSIVLGENADDFEIGPSVDLRCSRLEVRSLGFVVRGSRTTFAETDGVLIDAGQFQSFLQRKPVVRGSLSVSWPDATAYPWTDYAANRIDSGVDNKKVHQVQRRFRKIVTSLRSHSKGSLARFKDKIDHQRVLKGEMGKVLLHKLLDDGIIVLLGKFYHWVPRRADDILRVSWNELRQRRFSPEANAYLQRFIEENPHLF